MTATRIERLKALGEVCERYLAELVDEALDLVESSSASRGRAVGMRSFVIAISRVARPRATAGAAACACGGSHG